MNASQPLVSAVITTHNRADLLPRALDSVITQSYANLDIVVVDDGSTDQTDEVVKKYSQNHLINYIRLDRSVGACKARNKGIEEAKGEFVAGLDDDDKWHEQRIEKLLQSYSDEYACITSDMLMVYPRGEAVWNKQKMIDMDTLLYTNKVGNQVLVRRERLLEVGGFDPDLKAAQDYDLWIRLCEAFGPVRNVQEVLQTVYMDRQEERITGRDSSKGYLQFYNKHQYRFNRAQRKYQLYNIRRAQDKSLSLGEFIFWVPYFRYWDELKKIIANIIWD